MGKERSGGQGEREKEGVKDRKRERERGQETETGRNREHPSLTSTPLETGESFFTSITN